LENSDSFLSLSIVALKRRRNLVSSVSQRTRSPSERIQDRFPLNIFNEPLPIQKQPTTDSKIFNPHEKAKFEEFVYPSSQSHATLRARIQRRAMVNIALKIDYSKKIRVTRTVITDEHGNK
jgi:hypothetical protein